MIHIRFLYVFFFIIPFTVLYSQGVNENIAPAKKIVLNGREYYLHVVGQGEGLYRISVNYGVSQQEILEANDDISENLKVSQIVRIPVISGRNSNSGEMGKSRSYIYHTVEKGQTTFFVSRKYNVSPEVIYENNPGSKERLAEGAVLKIPVKESEKETVKNVSGDDFVYHTIQPKETLYSLAREYNTTMEKIIDANQTLQNGILSIGSTVRIPTAFIGKEPAHPIPSNTQQFIKSDDYLYHTILQGQTLYSIARQYQVQVQDLTAANEGITQESLKVGYMLRVPRPVFDEDKIKQIDESDLFIYHKVKRKETLYGISRTYHVDEDVINEVNPQVDFRNLENGTRLKIPTDAWFALRASSALHSAEGAGFSDSKIDMPPESSSLSLVTSNCSSLGIDSQTSIKVALLFPFQAKASTAHYVDSLPSLSGRNIAMRTKPFVEFYTGTLMAVDELKKQGSNITLSVYDIAPDTRSVQKALSDPELKNVDLIIGPGISNELPSVSMFSAEHAIPMVFPMSHSGPELANNPYMFQVNSSDTLYHDVIADEIVRQARGANLLVILPSSSEPDATKLAAAVKQKSLMQERVLAGSINYLEYKQGGDDLQGIQTLIDVEKHTYIVIPSKKQTEVSRLIPIINGIKTRIKAEVTLFGMQDWLRFQTIEPENMHQLNATVFSPFGIDYTDHATQEFIKKFRQWYHTEPHAVNPYFQSSDASTNYSRYGIWGYDVALYFLTAVGQYGKNFGMCLDSFQTTQIQFNFNFKRISNWGGFYNQGLYMIRFNSDYTTERIKLN
ncbi:MAG: LysM peptidoglycan-binding domain-containing protein [Cytophagaceae bacterium]|jgi:LysM repeat protein|nr:LysM peptidoglycan-binding domain-containing protein [Cytophagaceae bacterium]